jgi:ubiquinone/menaquinone biosynthesis C-methylase UbiE
MVLLLPCGPGRMIGMGAGAAGGPLDRLRGPVVGCGLRGVCRWAGGSLSSTWDQLESELRVHTDLDPQEFSFEPFSRHAFFTEVNRWIVDRVICRGCRRVVDLGCGPGAVTRLILDRLDPDGEVIAIDPSESALARAREAIRCKAVRFVKGSAEWVSRLVSAADAIVFLNAIHLVPDKAQVLSEIRRALRAGGSLAFNTTFFNGAYVEGTAGFWRRWIVRAVQVLRERGLDVQRTAKAVARQFLSAEEYAQLCVQAGFAPPDIELLQIEMTPESLEDIGRFSLFIEGALPGVPLEDGAEALREGLRRTCEETGRSSVPRNWLECVATAV